MAQNEAYSSQCSPLAPSVDKDNARKENRVHRGLYCDAGMTWNADAVGAFNILRLYTKQNGVPQKDAFLPKNPYVVKVAV
jgi:putative transposase